MRPETQAPLDLAAARAAWHLYLAERRAPLREAARARLSAWLERDDSGTERARRRGATPSASRLAREALRPALLDEILPTCARWVAPGGAWTRPLDLPDLTHAARLADDLLAPPPAVTPPRPVGRSPLPWLGLAGAGLILGAFLLNLSPDILLGAATMLGVLGAVGLVLWLVRRVGRTDAGATTRPDETLITHLLDEELDRLALLAFFLCAERQFARAARDPEQAPPPTTAILDAITTLVTIADQDAPHPEILREAALELRQTMLDEGYHWSSIPDGTPYRAAMGSSFRSFGRIEPEQPVTTLKAALLYQDRILVPGRVTKVRGNH